MRGSTTLDATRLPRSQCGGVKTDFVAVPKDVAKLVLALPNVIECQKVDFDLWSHLELLWLCSYGMDAKELVHDGVVELIAKRK